MLARAFVAALLVIGAAQAPAPAAYVLQIYQGALGTAQGEASGESVNASVVAVRSAGVRNAPEVEIDTGAVVERCVTVQVGVRIEVGCGVPSFIIAPDLTSASAMGGFPSIVCDEKTGEILGTSTLHFVAVWSGSGPLVASVSASGALEGDPDPRASIGLSRSASLDVGVMSMFLGEIAFDPGSGTLVEGIDSSPLIPVGPGPCGSA